jgi:hypothetical protein
MLEETNQPQPGSEASHPVSEGFAPGIKSGNPQGAIPSTISLDQAMAAAAAIAAGNGDQQATPITPAPSAPTRQGE